MQISPKIYHIDNLPPADRLRIRESDYLMKETLRQRRAAIMMDLDDPTTTMMERMRLEEHLAALQDVWDEYFMERLDDIVWLMEQEPEEYWKHVKEREPENLGKYWEEDADD